MSLNVKTFPHCACRPFPHDSVRSDPAVPASSVKPHAHVLLRWSKAIKKNMALIIIPAWMRHE